MRLLPGALYQCCFLGAVALYKSAANAVVISRYGAGALPWLYVGAAAVTAALAAWNAAVPGRRLNPSTFGVLGCAACLAAALGLTFQAPLVALAAYVFAEVFTTSVMLSFWSAVTDTFDVRSARKAFSFLNGIGMLGAVAGGLLAQVMAPRIGAPPLFIAAAALLAGAAMAWRFQAPPESVARSSNRPARGAWGYVAGAPYARRLGSLVLAFSVLSVLCDYLFRERAGALLDEASMAASFGALQLWNGVFSAAFQLVVAELLLKRLGILRYLGLVPLALGSLALVVLAAPGIGAAWALKLVESGATLSLLPVGFQLLYGPLPDDVRDGARSAIDGFLRKGGLAVGGVLLLFGARFAHGAPLAATVALLCGWISWSLWRIRPRYLEMLHTRVAGATQVELSGLDERLLVQALRSEDPKRVLRAVDLLEAVGAPLGPHLRDLIHHRNERVRERGVLLALELKATGVARDLEELLFDAARRPRDAAVWALPALVPERAKRVLPLLIQVPDVGLKTAAVGAWLLIEPKAEAPLKALDGLLEKGPAAGVPERRKVARLLGRLGPLAEGTSWSAALAKRLDDGDVSVRRVAIEAVGAGRYLELAPKLLRFLTFRDERRAAREALEAMGEAVVPLVGQALDDKSRAASLRYQLPRVLRQIGTQSAFDALLFSNAHDDAFLHYRVGVSIARLKGEQPELVVDATRAQEALERRLETYRALKEPLRDLLAALGPASLATRAVRDRVDQAFELSFLLLGLKYGERTMRRAHAQLKGADAKGRAWARELLDNLLTEHEAEALREPLDDDALLGSDSGRLNDRLMRLCRAEDRVVRATARAEGRKRGLWPNEYKEDDMSEVTVKKLLALEGVEVFAECDVDDLAAIAAVAREQRFKAGERVYAEGDPGDALYVVVEGEAVARHGGETVIVTRAKEAFGEVSLFDGAPRVTEVVARVDTRTLVIDRRDFLDLLADRPELLTGVFRVLSRQLKNLVVEVSSRKATGEVPRVAATPLP